MYTNACDEILDFRVTSVSSLNGKKGAYIIRNDENIPIDSMGEGIVNILGLLVDLCRVENKLFIIEELENDIHPKALKKLLELITSASAKNQFVISTHSNIVVRHLASFPGTKLFNVEMGLKDKIPTSKVDEIDTFEKRKSVLEDLGYELFDYELWNYWLFLEESSAEKIIRDYLIPWFLPSLKGKVRTFSAGSASQIQNKFENFNSLFVYLHLEPQYKNKVWVIIDGGSEEEIIIEKLRKRYVPSGWKSSTFSQFEKHSFEEYYPQVFSEDIERVLHIADKDKKRQQKKELLDQVLKWIEDNRAQAKDEFAKSAAEVIMRLKEIFPDGNSNASSS
jgi:hypothetical protein